MRISNLAKGFLVAAAAYGIKELLSPAQTTFLPRQTSTGTRSIGPAIKFPLDSLLRDQPQTGKCKDAFFSVMYNNNDPKTVQQWIAKCPDYINAKRFHDIPALHISVMGDNTVAEDQLLNAGAKVNARDFNGYAALHHQALKGNVVGVDKLLAKGANPKSRTKLGATYMDFLRFNEPFRSTPYPLNSTLFSAHNAKVEHDLNPKCLHPQVKFVYENVARPEMLAVMWGWEANAKSKKEIERLSPFLRVMQTHLNEKYAAFKKQPPKLAIKPVETDDAGTPLNMQTLPCGLFAVHPIKKGDVIAEYTGEIVSDAHAYQLTFQYALGIDATTYLWKDSPAVDAMHYRSAGAIANDGFPNAYVEQIQFNADYKKGFDGLTARKILFAMEDIPAGGEIVINYGPHDLTKTHGHLELRPRALKEYLGKHSWKELLTAMPPSDGNLEKSLDLLEMIRKVDYILQTPNAIPDLIKKGLFKRSDLQYLLEHSNNPAYSQNARQLSYRVYLKAKDMFDMHK